jgi:DNA-binding ferritin-like protein (Dps family)
MTMSGTEEGGFISRVIGPKRRWRAYKARVKQLPENYRTAVDAIEHYLMHFVPTDGDSVASEFEDLADLFERAAADGTPIREIVATTQWSSWRRLLRTTRRAGMSPIGRGNG